MAIELYQELKDLDFLDYSDTIENDLVFIQTFIDLYGYQDAKRILLNYFD